MVSKSEVVCELEGQGIYVAEFEEDLCGMARSLVTAAQAQVKHCWLAACCPHKLSVLLVCYMFWSSLLRSEGFFIPG